MTKKVKTFLHVFTNSLIPQAHYYSKIPHTHFSFSFKYFISLILILNFILIVSFVARFNPVKINMYIDRSISGLEKFPAGLNITIKNGVLLTNYNRPYFLWTDYLNKKKLLLVIDESATPQKIETFGSLFLLTRQELVFKNIRDNRSPSVIPLSSVSDQSITKSTVKRLVKSLNVLKTFLPILYLGLIVGLIIITPVASFVINIIYLLLINLIVFLFFKLFITKKLHFKKTFQISLHAATLPLTLDYFLMFFRPAIKIGAMNKLPIKEFSSPFAFTILLGIFIFAGLYESYLDAK